MSDEQPPGGSEEVGSVGEEAAKLLGALQDWARETGHQQAGAAGAAASGLVAGLQNLNEHLATGGEDCRYCPVCQAIALVRSTSPEVRTHLASAASSLFQAAASALATQVPTTSSRAETGVQKIDLDDEGWD